VPDGPHGSAGGEEAAVAVFTALAEPTRRRILDSLARAGPATVGELATRLPITRQAVAKHLAHLVEAGLLVADEPQGRRVLYRLRAEPVRAALAWLSALANQWDDRLGALARHLDDSAGA
jgi:DNA-binding transcriptional ArsR family regulator